MQNTIETISRNALIAEKLLTESGEVNTTRLHYLSGAYTIPFINELWERTCRDLKMLEVVYSYLQELYRRTEYASISAVIRILYIVHSIEIPKTIEALLAFSDANFKGIYLYEFLEDYQAVFSDFREQAAKEE